MLNDLQCLHYSSIHIYRESLRVVEYYMLNNGDGVNTARVYDIMLIRFAYSDTLREYLQGTFYYLLGPVPTYNKVYALYPVRQDSIGGI